MKPDFKAMSRKELKIYVLAHRNDSEAITAYIEKADTEGNWVTMPPLNSAEDINNYPGFLEKLHKEKEQHSPIVESSVKEKVIKVLETMPPEVTFEEIMERLYFLYFHIRNSGEQS